MPNSVPAQLLNAIKGRKFTSVARLFAPNVDFQAWTNLGHWVANDPQTAARIIEVWYSPGTGNQVTDSNEITGARGLAILELEVTWKAPPDEQPRMLRQVYLMTVKNDRIVQMRVYCPGLHAEFPDVDLEKQRRQKGLSAAPAKTPAGAKAVAARSS
ncbi:MAG TPA: hypothetical protein VFC53_03530 [Dehalococcoidia bacterium]|jgi:hypothetical protein|nr:hypothetical protein [Dehalococcoidia bacterium]